MNTDQKKKTPSRRESDDFKYGRMRLEESNAALIQIIRAAFKYDIAEHSDCNYLYKEIDKLVVNYNKRVEERTT